MHPRDDEDERATEPLTRVAVALEGLTIELRGSNAETAKCRESMTRVVAIGEEHRKIADQRREADKAAAEARRLEEREDRAEEREKADTRIDLLTKAAASMWGVVKPGLALLVMAWVSYLGARYLGVVGDGAKAAPVEVTQPAE